MAAVISRRNVQSWAVGNPGRGTCPAPRRSSMRLLGGGRAAWCARSVPGRAAVDGSQRSLTGTIEPAWAGSEQVGRVSKRSPTQ